MNECVNEECGLLLSCFFRTVSSIEDSSADPTVFMSVLETLLHIVLIAQIKKKKFTVRNKRHKQYLRFLSLSCL